MTTQPDDFFSRLRTDELDTMKSTITSILVLLAVASARNVNYPAISLPDVSSPSLPSRQWNTQDEIGQASFGYSYPGQAASNVLDSATGNMAGSWAYINPEGKVVNVSYIADQRGFRVSSTVLPAAVAPVADLAVEPAATTGLNPKAVPTLKDDDNCIANFPLRSKRQAGEEVGPDETNFGTSIKNEMAQSFVPSLATMHETGRNQYPFMVALLKFDETSRRYKLACGGSLLTATKILTAAQCVIQDNKVSGFDHFLVKLGMHFLNETADDATLTMRINQVDIHEDYDQETKVNDIAIVTLESPVEFTDKVSTVCVPKACHQGAHSGYALTLGWGNTKKGERNSDVLRQTTAEMTTNKWCTETHMRRNELADHMMCALATREFCQNYDGSPLILTDNRRYQDCPWVQFGILIYGSGCTESDERQPSVYLRLTSFWTWIDNQVNPWQ